MSQMKFDGQHHSLVENVLTYQLHLRNLTIEPRGGRKTAKVAGRIDFITVSTYFRPKKFKSAFKSILPPHLQHVPSIATTTTTTIATAKLAIFCTMTL